MPVAVASAAQAALANVLETAVAHCRSDFGLLSLYDPVTCLLREGASIGFDSEDLDRLATIAPGPLEGACGSAFATRCRAVVLDTESDPRFEKYRDGARKVGFRSVHSVPVVGLDGVARGVLSVHYREPHEPSEREIQLLDLLGLHAADLLEHEDAKAATKKSERRLRAILDNLNRFVGLLDVDGRLVEANGHLLAFMGLNREESLGQALKDTPPFIGSESLHARVGSAVEAAKAGETTTMTSRHLQGDGGTIDLEFVIRPFRDDSDRIVGIVAEGKDISDDIRTDHALRRSESFARGVMENTPDCVKLIGLDGRIKWVNGSAVQLLEVGKPEDLLGRHWLDMWSRSEPPERARQALEEAVRGGVARFEASRPTARGNIKWWDVAIVAIPDPEGRPDLLLAVSRDVTERMKVQLALHEADAKKDEFLATLAHELRNPLAPIRMGLDLMRHRNVRPEDQVATVQMMSRQVDQLVRLVDDLLDVSRITQGKLVLRRADSDLSDIVDSAMETVRPLYEEMGHDLVVALPSKPVRVNADPTRLAQVFSNLLNNSARYSERGGRVELRAVVSEGWVGVSVKDQGFGIEVSDLDSIFEMFSQGSRSRPECHSGLGIGLTLVKRLVEMHGGTIQARSEGPGRGSEFVVRLPVASQDGADELEEEASAPEIDGLRVLVVDDNQDAADFMSLSLRLSGHDTRTVYDGLGALSEAEAFRPDIVFLDVGMPGMDGIEVAKNVRRSEWGKDIVLVAVTGWGQEEDRRRTREAGFDHHLVKPVGSDAVSPILAEATTRRAATRGGSPSA
ncbi:MAG: PAS domain-containing protein [Armatimonadetes bacterium]|nr:PAS domain-containing protein [Armatimonadota bacterium]